MSAPDPQPRPETPPADAAARHSRIGLAIGAAGVVYGDIGTSPLYALRAAFGAVGQVAPLPENVLGVLSLVFWAVMVVVTGKYVGLMLRADNRGEGGIMALTALAIEHLHAVGPRKLLLTLGLIGAALFYGDSLITPAISVLSATEGIEIDLPRLTPFIPELCAALLVGLFLLQGKGTPRVAALFGPVMVAWFTVLAVLGVANIALHPRVLAAIDPLHAVSFCRHVGFGLPLLALLSAVVLALTGAEAIYEQLGRFGRDATRRAWLVMVLPALLLNYFGQGALILGAPEAARAPFFLLAPDWARLPLVVLATVVTIIASQAVVTGTFAMTHQAIQLGFLPRLAYRHTSATAYGQIFLPNVSRVMMLLIVFMVLGFKTSSELAHAYGLAVTGTMLIGTVLGAIVARSAWKWSRGRTAAVFGLFLLIDLIFLIACATKIPAGGWLPVTVALVTFTLIQCWREGRGEMTRYREDAAISLEAFLARLSANRAPRVAGTAVFMSASPASVPSALLHNLKHNKVLHERVVLLTILTEQVPVIAEPERITVVPYPHAFYRVVARYGFIESPDVTQVLAACAQRGLAFDMMETSFFLGRDTLVPAVRSRIPRWRERVFFWLWRNSSSVTDFFRIPPNRVIELGSQVEI